jgi:hypothetical protein
MKSSHSLIGEFFEDFSDCFPDQIKTIHRGCAVFITMNIQRTINKNSPKSEILSFSKNGSATGS